MDKQYFHNKDDKFGWLETSSDVVQREMKAYKKLAEIEGIKLPQTIEVSGEDYPMLTGKDGGEAKKAQSGYFVEHLEFGRTFKPKMMTLGVPKAIVNTYKNLPTDEAKAQMRGDLKAIQDKLGGISDVVGELTLATNPRTGAVYILDVGPNSSGDVGGGPAKSAHKGLDKILEACK
ncbi:hypothetical protein ACN28S_52725 [Cystobacter fuscus]